MTHPTEEPLVGGRLTAGVVRVGDTVRRPRSPASAFVAQLLNLLEGQGFTGAPRHLGIDEHGRDILTYIEGTVPARFQRWEDQQVAAAGHLLRRFHEATRGSTLAGGHAVVVHGDAGPNNTVFGGGPRLPTAFIDFDTAGPGDPVTDVAYQCWTWTISSKTGAWPAAAQAAQMRVLTDAYGSEQWEPDQILDAVLERQADNARWWRSRLTCDRPLSATTEQIEERAHWSDREYAFTLANRPTFQAALER
ncbi:aminoglycoside phosphotransferase family protein [Streptacidiphilus sp. EB103A]|uniref:aminoglycoside phosphotransferase family protein n=1 Tax=Streptacidiphilus sp. EB103A TaxID=3156275 RepID=UPI003519B4A8